jgi:Holliday junction resolvase RusA-like endonuclease
MIRYELNLAPIAWARPGKSGTRSYDTQKQLKLQYGLWLKKQQRDQTIDYPISVTVLFYFHFPKAKGFSYHSGKKDIDNLNKFIFDVMVDCGIIKDDNIICRLISSKLKNPYQDKIIIEIEKL